MLQPLAATLLFLLLAAPALAASEPVTLHDKFAPAAPRAEALELLFENGRQEQVRLSDFRGRYVLLNIWATWCGPCVRGMPSLDALQAQLDPGQISIIALAEDRMGAVTVPAFYQRHELKNLTTYLDPKSLAMRRLNLRGLPTTLLIDPEGREIGRIENEVDWLHPANLDFLAATMATQTAARVD